MLRSLSCLLAATVAVSTLARGQQALTLEQVLDEAVSRNLRLVAERLNLTIAEARLLQARLRPNPVLSLGGNYLDILGSGFNPATNAAGPTEINVRLDFLFERGKKRQQRVAVAEAAKGVAQADFLNTMRTLVLDVQYAFTDLLLAKENAALARANLAAFDQIVAINKTRVNSGDLARVELIRSEVAQLQFANQVRQAELRLRLAANRLQTLMGRTVFDPRFDVRGELRRDAVTYTKEDLLKMAISTRPDLDALRRDQARSQAELRLQLAQAKVDYTFGAAFNRQFGVGGLRSGNSAGLFLSVALPVLNKNQGEIERARREQEQIEARLRSLEQEIQAEVENAFASYETAKQLLERIETALLERASRVRDVMDFSYRRGEATLVEFLDAQRAYNETMLGYQEARAEYGRALFLIDAITGKGYSK
ncbi:MAG: TolC family protein [Bryobacteraceae bacterium]|nr:TolC family protein [Bryobacteraceae bacterium]MDW8376662.1 TolC family protein [Bryobacterales bacterium]